VPSPGFNIKCYRIESAEIQCFTIEYIFCFYQCSHQHLFCKPAAATGVPPRFAAAKIPAERADQKRASRLLSPGGPCQLLGPLCLLSSAGHAKPAKKSSRPASRPAQPSRPVPAPRPTSPARPGRSCKVTRKARVIWLACVSPTARSTVSLSRLIVISIIAVYINGVNCTD
jgi:hypothetical protein